MDQYCESIFKTKRWPTRVVPVGNVLVGGNNPVRIQSMTTSSTRDVDATVEQIIKLADWGCEIARVTVQGIKEAEACDAIKDRLIQKGYTIPVVADIHFFPPAAMRVVDSVDKVRINPGNFVDKRASFKVIEYDDVSYAKELERIEEKFTPLVEKCKRLKRAMRIGTNHGSLSDRIMNRYGDSPAGMVESALEFARICRKNDYNDIIFSMKASNPVVMIHAYRLLVAEMKKLGWDYPLHLGVTEAGLGEDGRIKSAMGIGSLLLDGLGDTIRVSLTEDPWYEIDPCKRLVEYAETKIGEGIIPFEEQFRNFDRIEKRPVQLSKSLSLHRDGSVYLNAYPALQLETKLQRDSADGVIIKEGLSDSLKNHLQNLGIGAYIPLTLSEAKMRRFSIPLAQNPLVLKVSETELEKWTALEELKPALILWNPAESRLHATRRFFDWLRAKHIQTPVLLNFSYSCSSEDLIIQASAECGALLCDGLGDGLYLEGPYEANALRSLSFGILQAARMRSFKTDFISCPSCGRTLFDLQDVTKRIKERTDHLPGVKIAIMGCIVNGPGEMADADFGYVGSKPGMIDLYVGKSCVQKDIPFAEADDRLIDLIKAHGRWAEKLV